MYVSHTSFSLHKNQQNICRKTDTWRQNVLFCFIMHHTNRKYKCMDVHWSYSVSQKILSPRFSEFFSQRLTIFNQNFTPLLYLHIYSKLLNFIRLSLNLTKFYHIKYNHPLNFHFSLRANCTDFIPKDEWPPNSPDFNPFDYHLWGAMLHAFHNLHSKPKTIPELKSALQQIWDDLTQTMINKAVNDFRKRLNKCVSAGGGHGTFWAHDGELCAEIF